MFSPMNGSAALILCGGAEQRPGGRALSPSRPALALIVMLHVNHRACSDVVTDGKR